MPWYGLDIAVVSRVRTVFYVQVVVALKRVVPVFLDWHAQRSFSIRDREEDRGETQGLCRL